MPSHRAGRSLAFESESSEATPFLSMGYDRESSDQPTGLEGLKAFPEAVITEPSVFARNGKKTFETESLESFYKPIASYEGAHRFDPAFEWEAKEERRLVRKVYLSILCYQPSADNDIDRSKDMCLGVFDVLRSAAGQRKHLPGSLRQSSQRS